MPSRVILFAGFLIVGLGWSPAGVKAAEGDLPLPSRPPGEILRIPGLPPIELPPGAKIFGPHGPELGNAPPRSKPSVRGEPPAASPMQPDAEKAGTPSAGPVAPKLTAEAQRAQVLDELFKQLAVAKDPADAKNVAAAIQHVWDRSGSDTADLLTTRAMAAAGAGKTDVALELLDHVVELMPDWAEGWNKRATIRFLADDYDGAMADIDSTLALEPRHFGSLGGLATILQRSGLDRRALEIMRQVLTLYPQQPDLQKAIDRLAPDIDGRDI